MQESPILDSKSKVTYEDDEYELFRSPTDPNKKFTWKMPLLSNATVLNIEWSFVPDDQIGVKKQGDNGSNDTVRKDQYKYALGNENVIDAHVYQINPNLPKIIWWYFMAWYGTISEHSLCSILW